jgi:hypothetical protein
MRETRPNHALQRTAASRRSVRIVQPYHALFFHPDALVRHHFSGLGVISRPSAEWVTFSPLAVIALASGLAYMQQVSFSMLPGFS